jgi:hypothetical protein
VKINNVGYSWPGTVGAANTVLTSDASGNLTWTPAATQFTNSGASDIYRSTGNVGIGTTTSPTQKLDVYGNINITSAAGSTLFMGANGSGTPGTVGEKIQLSGTAGTLGANDYSIGYEPNNLWFNTASGMKWYKSGVLEMALDSTGNLGIGTTTVGARLHVDGSSAIFGAGEGGTATVGQNFIIKGASGAGSNTTGANLTFQPGNGTGSGKSGSLIFQTAPAGSSGTTATTMATRMTVTADGNVGIGTTAPVAQLAVVNTTNTPAITVGQTSGTSANGDLTSIDFLLRNTAGGGMSTPAVNYDARIGAYVDGASVNQSGLSFYTRANAATVSERMRISYNGNVGIGTTNPAQKLQVGSSGDGTVALANSWNTFSDIRLKRDLSSIPDALDKLLELHGYYYFWKNGTDHSRQVGVVAQEVESIFPELVRTGSDGIKTVDYPKLSAVLIESTRQLKAEKDAEISQLKAESAQLKAESAQLKAESAQLKAESAQIKAALCKKFPDLPMCGK